MTPNELFGAEAKGIEEIAFPRYPMEWEQWLLLEKPKDLTEDEEKWLMRAPFENPPKPYRYGNLLDILRTERSSKK
jgi:hypothetical protein